MQVSIHDVDEIAVGEGIGGVLVSVFVTTPRDAQTHAHIHVHRFTHMHTRACMVTIHTHFLPLCILCVYDVTICDEARIVADCCCDVIEQFKDIHVFI